MNAIGIFVYNKNMLKAKRKSVILIVSALLMLGVFNSMGTTEDRIIIIELAKLHGDWNGVGTYMVPFTNMNASFEGDAKFVFDSTNNYLRTFISAENLLFAYSDSGHLQFNVAGDSATWELWNSWGYHFKYRGTVKGKIISGSRLKGKLKYDVYVEIVNYDSISCRLILTDEKGESSEQASCSFVRVVKE